VNAHILALESRLREVAAHRRGAELDLIGLFCECGCMGELAMTREDYDTAGGAWLEGHAPTHRGGAG
jgi:hypothetical protein